MSQVSKDVVYQLHMRLAYIEPPIWRRIAVSGQITLFNLHRMFQVVMGWENYHLHQFIVGTTRYGEPDPEYEDGMKDDRRVRLQKIASEEGASFVYEYDFGDGWRHAITVERIEPWTQDMFVPRCLDGARACPPEDCGGIGGYEHLLEALRDRRHPEHKELRAWAGRTLIQSYFPCKRLTQPWLSFNRAFFSEHLTRANRDGAIPVTPKV